MRTYAEIDSQELGECRRTAWVRNAVTADLSAIVEIHQKAFGNFFLTQLGAAFLKRYYALVLDYPKGIVLVTERTGSLEGFACGFVEPAEFYRLMWRRRWIFAALALRALLRRPSLAMGVVDGIQRVQRSTLQDSVGSCELSSIAIAPEASGKGSGKALLQAFIARAQSMDAESVYLNTDADGNEQANALYQRAGFQRTDCFLQRRRRRMNEYVIDDIQSLRALEYAAE